MTAKRKSLGLDNLTRESIEAQTVLNVAGLDDMTAPEEERKELKTKRITILVTEETFSYLKERAYRENESMGSIIGALIEKDRAEHES
jgi:hypothetical protein